MDRPKLEVSWLECFPPDIWAYIVWYLPGEQLGRLLMTGATLLWHRLKSPHVVKSIKLGDDFLIFFDGGGQVDGVADDDGRATGGAGQ